MHKELEEKLYEKYPWLKPTDGFGLGVGDGWYEIINHLAGYMNMAIKFENECIERFKNSPEGFTWKPKDKPFDYPVIHQVKEKFGGLRFYCATPIGTRYEFRGAIDFAESISFTICEDCGNKGTTKKVIGWVRTLCDSCYIRNVKARSKNFSKMRIMEAKREVKNE